MTNFPINNHLEIIKKVDHPLQYEGGYIQKLCNNKNAGKVYRKNFLLLKKNLHGNTS